jgi:osmoprotectant transport system ATP-binding protein
MDSAPEALIQFENVSYSVPGLAQPILADLSFTVARGETLILLGESGSGKTTTLRLINRLLLPTSGRVLVEGKATTDWDAIQLRRHIGYVIQEAGLFPHFSVERNVALVPSLQNDDSESNRRRAHEMLRLVGLDPQTYGTRYPHELSGGQRQRVGVARALAADPPLLLLDEPFGALDPLTRSALQQEFKALCADLGKTAVLVTHDVREALLLGTRIALMRDGHIAVLATPHGFLQSDDPGAQAYQTTLQLVQNVA